MESHRMMHRTTIYVIDSRTNDKESKDAVQNLIAQHMPPQSSHLCRYPTLVNKIQYMNDNKVPATSAP